MEALGLNDWKYLSNGAWTTAYISPSMPDKVLVSSADGVKRYLAAYSEYLENSLHLPKIKYVGRDKGGYNRHLFIMPRYEVGIPYESTPAGMIYHEYLDSDRMDEFIDPKSKRDDRIIQFITSDLFTRLPERLQEEFLWLAAIAEDYAKYSGREIMFDLHDGNLAVDKETGNLILLDIFHVV